MKRCLVAGVVAGVLMISLSGIVRAADLMELYRQAQSNDPVFEAARHAREATHEKRPQAVAGLLPTLSLSQSNRSTRGSVSFDQADQVEREVRTRDFKLELNQPLIRPQNWAAYAQADWQVAQADAQFEQARQDLILRLAQAYFDVLAAEDAVAAADAQKSAMEVQLDVANRGYRAGTAAVTDVHEARSRFELTQAQAIAARNELEGKRSALEQIVGVAPDVLTRLRVEVRLPRPQPTELAAWVNAARENGAVVRVQLAAAEVAEREVTRSRAGHLPTLDFVASRNRNYSSGSLTSPSNIDTAGESTVVGLQLNVPLFAGGAVDSRVQEAKSLAYKARAELDSARRAAAHSARLAHAGVMNGLAQIEAMTQAVTSSKSAVEGNKIGYRVGTRINVDVLNAEQQLYSAQRDLARARYDTMLHGLRLKAAAGQLTEDDLQILNGLLVQ